MEYADAGDESLTDISFEAEKGQTIGVIGGTGSGKSTLVNLIPRFYDVSRGAVLVDGVDVRQYPKGALIEKIGVVPQKAMLFAGTVRDNMRWGNENASDDAIWRALETAQAKDVVESKEGGLDFPAAHDRPRAREAAGDPDYGRQCERARLRDGRRAPESGSRLRGKYDDIYCVAESFEHHAGGSDPRAR